MDICTNRKAFHDYHVLETIEAGIVLLGTEIKVVREKKVSLDSSYVIVENGEVWLLQSHIEEYKNGTAWNHEPKRKRKLLMHKYEIKKFAESATQKGLTIVPLKMYLKNGRAKLEIAIVKGKQLHDKRQAIKERDAKREIARME